MVSAQSHKRPEIQGLRAVSILGVMLFHIWPGLFSNGFLGVDVFFVISGYLMAQILTKRPLNRASLAHFYVRRVHRIVPIYLWTLLATLLTALVLLIQSDFQSFRTDLFWALGFATNVQNMMNHADYFSTILQCRLLVHSWSLAVELQFYVMAPALVWALLWLSRQFVPSSATGHLVKMAAVASLMAPSWLAQMLMGGNSPVAFGLVFCRLWQFLAGMSAHFLLQMVTECWPAGNTVSSVESEEPSNEKEEESALPPNKGSTFLPSAQWPIGRGGRFKMRLTAAGCLTASLVLALFSPVQLPAGAVSMARTMVVLLAAMLLCLHAFRQKEAPPVLLTNPVAVHIGDLSYVWYLVHWPVIQFVKYYFFINEFNCWEGTATLAVTFVLSQIIDWFVDRQFRAIKSTRALAQVVLALAALNLLFASTTFHRSSIEEIPSADPRTYMDPFEHRLNATQPFLLPLSEATTFGRALIEALNNENIPRNQRQKLAQSLSTAERVKLNELLAAVGQEDSWLRLLPGEQRSRLFSGNDTSLDAIFQNQQLVPTLERHRKGSGRQTVLAVGNSFMQGLAHTLQLAAEHFYSDFHVFAIIVCMPFNLDQERLFPAYMSSTVTFQVCREYAKAVQRALETVKPDVFFLNFFWYPQLPSLPVTEPLEEDWLFRQLQAFLDHAQRHVRGRIFVPIPTVTFDESVPLGLARRLWLGQRPENLHRSYANDYVADYKFIRQRLAHLRCPKCVFYEMSAQFCDKKRDLCLAYDEQSKLAYYQDMNHLSYHGLLKIRPFLRKLIRS